MEVRNLAADVSQGPPGERKVTKIMRKITKEGEGELDKGANRLPLIPFSIESTSNIFQHR